MKSVTLLLYLTVIFHFVSCNKGKEEIFQVETKIINVNHDKYKPVFKWENYIDSIKIIPLETQKRSVFSMAHKLIYKNNKYYIFDLRMQEIFVFNHKGVFDHTINQRGKGPGQYNVIKDFQIDKEDNLIILDYQNVHIYDSNYHHIKTIKFNETGEVLNLCFFDEANFFTFNDPVPVDNDNYLIYSYKKSIIRKFLKNEFDVLLRNRFIEHKDEFYMLPPFYDNNIYKFSQDSISTAYQINFDEKFFPTRHFVENSIYEKNEINQYLMDHNVIYMIGSFFEFDNFIFFNYVSKGMIYSASYIKSTHTVEVGKKSLLYNTIPISIINNSESDNSLIALLDPYLLISKKLSDNFLSDHPEMSALKNLEATDNPMIIKLYIK